MKPDNVFGLFLSGVCVFVGGIMLWSGQTEYAQAMFLLAIYARMKD